MLSLTINKHNAEQRLDRFLRKTFPAAPLSLIFAVIRKKKVRVNGAVGKAAQILCENDELKIYESLPQSVKKTLTGKVNLNFVFKNADFAVLNKPCGLASQSGSGISEEESLVGMLDIWARSEGLDFKPALVHRLDKETSGLIIAALSGSALREFGRMLREREIRKEYLALVKGRMPQKSGKISMPLPGDTKNSESIWKVEKSYEECDWVRVRLETGRKHQIRIHFAQIGHPLLGDSKHGDFALNRRLKISRLFLHSTLLEFNWQGKKVKFEAELPEELEHDSFS
ncbi:MAG: RluA family pseudouridine synthase [Fibromonadaceae bacterium]|jgi:23S rRNA pseudouridine955/2504/2580 synthase|nr:RluA family pseudouridine synthase [Fibromonadaceae bacterium]